MEPTNILSIPADQFADNFNLDISALTKQYPAGKNQLDYLPWSACVVLMKKYHPTFVFELELSDGKPVFYLPDGSAFVSVVIVDTSTGKRSTPSHFPVMSGFGHKAVIEPDSRAVSDSIQRAKAKALAEVTGIGLNLWLRVEEVEFVPESPSRETRGTAPAKRSSPPPAPVVEDEEYEEDAEDRAYAEDFGDDEVFEDEDSKPLARRTRPAPTSRAAATRPAASRPAQSRRPAPSRGANPFG